MAKINLAVNVRHEICGTLVPISIIWEDGRVFEIDRLLEVRAATSLKAGGVGVRYLCRISNKMVALFNEESRWFIEK